MKDRTLYHLLTTSARSAQRLVDGPTAARIEEASRTLVVERASRQPYHLTWTDREGVHVIEIDSSRFEFHLRGDVPSLVAKRRPNLDLRQSNWAEAHRVWGEIVGDDTLRRLEATPSRAMPAPIRRSVPPTTVSLAPAFVAVVGAILAHVDQTPRPVIAAVLGITAAFIGHRLREALTVSLAGIAMGAALGVAAAWSADTSGEALRSVTAGAALLVAVAELAPTPADHRLGPVRVGLAVLATVAAIAAASPTFIVGAAVLFVVDIVALVVRGDHRRLAAYVSVAAAASIAGLVLRAASDGPPTRPDGAGQAATIAVWVLGLAVILVGTRAATEGVRDRLAGSAAPVVAGIIGITEHGGGSAIAIMLAATLIALVARTAPIWLPHDRVLPRPPPPPLPDPGVTVAIRARPDRG